jgi:AraC-like DNA-binding protein
LKAVTDYVGDNLASSLSLEELSRQANLDPYHFSRLLSNPPASRPTDTS